MKVILILRRDKIIDYFDKTLINVHLEN